MVSKKKKMSWMMVTGIIGIVSAFCMFFFAFIDFLQRKESQNTTVTIIQNENYTKITRTDMNWDVLISILGGTLVIMLSITLIILYLLWRKDSISVCDTGLKLVTLRKKRNIRISDIKSCKSSNSTVFLKLKNELRPIKIMFIQNAYEISNYINEKIKTNL